MLRINSAEGAPGEREDNLTAESAEIAENIS
jgi:hypothetical protein